MAMGRIHITLSYRGRSTCTYRVLADLRLPFFSMVAPRNFLGSERKIGSTNALFNENCKSSTLN